MSFISALFYMSVLATTPFNHQHSAWTQVLHQYVDKGTLNFDRLNSPKGIQKLDTYLKQLESVQKDSYQKWTQKEQIAFWLNAYNAYATQLILSHIQKDPKYMEIDRSGYKDPFVPIHLLGTDLLSLDRIEDHLRSYGDPRIHFALVC